MRRSYECCQIPTDYKISNYLNGKGKSYFKYKTRFCNRPLGDFILYHEFKTHSSENHKLQAESLFIFKNKLCRMSYNSSLVCSCTLKIHTWINFALCLI
jgi:hypothetical protein